MLNKASGMTKARSSDGLLAISSFTALILVSKRRVPLNPSDGAVRVRVRVCVMCEEWYMVRDVCDVLWYVMCACDCERERTRERVTYARRGVCVMCWSVIIWHEILTGACKVDSCLCVLCHTWTTSHSALVKYAHTRMRIGERCVYECINAWFWWDWLYIHIHT